jgi:hypothetical protein
LDEEEGPPEAALVREYEGFGVDEEDIPDAESAIDAVRRGPTCHRGQISRLLQACRLRRTHRSGGVHGA